jgi:hypothetical protein
MTVTSEEGQFFHKAADDRAAVCGVYFVTDPDRRVEVHFDYLDVPCQNGGLVSVSHEYILEIRSCGNTISLSPSQQTHLSAKVF